MRLFTAIHFDNTTANALYEITANLKKQGVTGNFTRPDNLHLTLVFIGQAPREDSARAALDMVNVTPFSLTLKGLGVFQRSGEILWMGVEGPPELYELQRQIAYRLSGAGFSVDDRPYKPHITLARRTALPGGFDIADVGNAISPITVEAKGFSLMASTRDDRGRLVYEDRYQRHFI